MTNKRKSKFSNFINPRWRTKKFKIIGPRERRRFFSKRDALIPNLKSEFRYLEPFSRYEIIKVIGREWVKFFLTIFWLILSI